MRNAILVIAAFMAVSLSVAMCAVNAFPAELPKASPSEEVAIEAGDFCPQGFPIGVTVFTKDGMTASRLEFSLQDGQVFAAVIGDMAYILQPDGSVKIDNVNNITESPCDSAAKLVR